MIENICFQIRNQHIIIRLADEPQYEQLEYTLFYMSDIKTILG